MRLHYLLLAGIGLTLSAAAGAAEFSYTYGELRVAHDDRDRNKGDDAEGIALAGSFELPRNLFVSGGLSFLDGDSPNGADTDTLSAALGIRHPATPRIDLVGTLGFVYVDLSVPGLADDDDIGPQLTGGARVSITPQFEAGGYAQYVEVFSDGDVALLGEGLFHFTPQLTFIGGVRVSDDDRGVNLGARWNFPTARGR